MVGVIIISENKQAHEMLKTVKRLLGSTHGMKTLILGPGKPVETMRRQLAHSLKGFERMKGVILLTDIYGSTQCNTCMKFVKKGAVELISGFNLPLLIKLATLNQITPFKKLLPFIESYGREHLICLSRRTR